MKTSRAAPTIMGYIFRSGVYGCDPGGALVLLDVVGDRYFTLEGEAHDACRRLVAGAPGLPSDVEVISELMDADLLCKREVEARPLLCDGIACRGSVPIERGDKLFSAIGVISALVRLFCAIIELRFRSLDGVLTGLAAAKRKSSLSRHSGGGLAAIATSFARADRVMTALDLCLPRSIAISRTMVAHGLTPTLVIAVKLRPFAAHCWVQSGNTLVGDDVGMIAAFTPIFIL